MNWSRTKLIFLVAFLMLDLYLGYKLYHKRGEAADQIQGLVNKKSHRDILAENHIRLPSNLPQEKTATYIKGTAFSFVKSNTSNTSDQSNDSESQQSGSETFEKQEKKGQSLKPKIAKLPNQHLKTGKGGAVITSNFIKPVPLPDSFSAEEVHAALKNYVYKLGDYQPWKEKKGDQGITYTFVETYQDHPVFSTGKNLTGMLHVYVSKGHITGYQQSYLNLVAFNQKKDLVKPLKAIYILYLNVDFPRGSTVQSVELSYDNLIENAEKTKLFVPTWYIVVQTGDKKEIKEFFVNAFHFQIQTSRQSDDDGETGDSGSGSTGKS